MPGEVSTPDGPLYRIGRAPNPLDFPPIDRVGFGRFDDPDPGPRYRVLYAGERRACFFECLAPFRVSISGIASEGITAEWLIRRRIAALQIEGSDRQLRWLDLAAPETYFEFRITFSEQLRQAGFSDFDVSAATSERRELTQAIGQWAHERGYAGIRYVTRHAPLLQCWAVFENTAYSPIGPALPIEFDDADLQAVAHARKLRIPDGMAGSQGVAIE
jgi:hypothetical protein